MGNDMSIAACGAETIREAVGGSARQPDSLISRFCCLAKSPNSTAKAVRMADGGYALGKGRPRDLQGYGGRHLHLIRLAFFELCWQVVGKQ